jgi:hypothetical protein
MLEASISYPLPNFKAYYLRRAFSTLTRECDADDKLSITEFWRQFNIKMAIVMRLPFYEFSLYAAIRRNATSAYNESLHFSVNSPFVGLNILRPLFSNTISLILFFPQSERPTKFVVP